MLKREVARKWICLNAKCICTVNMIWEIQNNNLQKLNKLKFGSNMKLPEQMLTFRVRYLWKENLWNVFYLVLTEVSLMMTISPFFCTWGGPYIPLQAEKKNKFRSTSFSISEHQLRRCIAELCYRFRFRISWVCYKDEMQMSTPIGNCPTWKQNKTIEDGAINVDFWNVTVQTPNQIPFGSSKTFFGLSKSMLSFEMTFRQSKYWASSKIILKI